MKGVTKSEIKKFFSDSFMFQMENEYISNGKMMVKSTKFPMIRMCIQDAIDRCEGNKHINFDVIELIRENLSTYFRKSMNNVSIIEIKTPAIQSIIKNLTEENYKTDDIYRYTDFDITKDNVKVSLYSFENKVIPVPIEYKKLMGESFAKAKKSKEIYNINEYDFVVVMPSPISIVSELKNIMNDYSE